MVFAPHRWLQKKERQPAPRLQLNPPQVPDGHRVYAIGDVHGRADLLGHMRELIAADLHRAPAAQACTTILLGDYVDRGPDSKEVIEQLVSGEPFPTRLIALKGNHEAMLLGFLSQPESGEVWRRNGGVETLHSYGVDVGKLRLGRGFIAAAADFRDRLPPSHLAFLRQLQCSISIGDYYFCHAGVRPGVPLDSQRDEDLIWIRGEFLGSDEYFGKIVVHGHNVAAEPEIKPNRISVDTGAYISNRLTCVVLQGIDQRFLQAVAAPGHQFHLDRKQIGGHINHI